MRKKILFSLMIFLSLSVQAQLEKNVNSSIGVVSFNEVDTQPTYPGGSSNLVEFVVRNIQLPEIEEPGTIIVSFIIESDGSMNDYKILKDIGGESGKAIIEVLKKSKKWNPGEHKGLPARVRYNLTIKVG